jgi:hypothetical protein
MTSITDLPALDGCEDPAAVLAYARARKQVAEDAERELMEATAVFASMHSAGSVVGPADGWHERCLPVGGEGCPEVAEFAVTEYAAAMSRSPEAGRRQLSVAVEARYRLPRCWARLDAGVLPAWRLRVIAEQTMPLPPEAAAYVDAHVAPVAHKVGPAQLARLIAEAKARYAPEQAEADRAAAADARHVTLALADLTTAGTVHLDAEVDLADALDLEAALSAGAEQQRLAGSAESLQVRRSVALGELARGQQPLDFEPDEKPRPRRGRNRGRKREVVLHVHLEQAAVLGSGGLARIDEAAGPVTAEQVRLWCGNPETTVTLTPVIDLDEHIHVDSYQASERLKNQVDLREVYCIHPWCTRKAVNCDHDHRVDHDPDRDDAGPTCSCNLAPLCRRHHRARTTGGWSYTTVEPGVYLWRSPLGYHYLRDHTGTLDVTPDEQRRRLAREFTTHVGEP